MSHIAPLPQSPAICGLVLTLEGDPAWRLATIDRLRADDELIVGSPREGRVPVVLQVAGEGDLRRWWERLLQTPGVVHVDLAYVGYEDDLREETRGEG